MGFYISNGYEEDCKSMAQDLGTPPPFRRDDAYEYMLRNPLPPTQYSQPSQVNTNTYMSIGLFITILMGVVWLTSRLDKTDVRIDTLAAQVTAVQNIHESWGYHDMFKWTTHLRRDNPQMKFEDPEAPK